jgi:(1->4)-alpha-D-glucan 1-alpha-D-glucosylmutase
MGQVLDIVPNHMCVDSSENQWWMEVLENGPSSPYAMYFDIDWTPVKKELRSKVLLPILGDQYGNVLEGQELKVVLEEGAFCALLEHCPVEPRTYIPILEHCLRICRFAEARGSCYIITAKNTSVLCAPIARSNYTVKK